MLLCNVLQLSLTLLSLFHRHWNNKGAKSGEWDNLVVQFQARQNQKQSWSMDDTKATLQSVTMEKKGEEIHPQDVEAYHNNLIALHNTQNHINQQIQIQEQRLKECPPMIPVKVQQQSRKQPPPSSSSVKANRFDKNNSKYDGIDLPSPADGNLMYTPSECVTTIMNFMQGSNNTKPNRSDVRRFKEKIIATRLVPISISQLNYLLAKHGGPGKDPAPRYVLVLLILYGVGTECTKGSITIFFRVFFDMLSRQVLESQREARTFKH